MNIPKAAFSASHVAARDVAVRNPVSCSATDSVALALARLDRSFSEYLVVLDARGRLIGLVTRRDLVHRVVGRKTPLVGVPVEVVMSAPIFSVGPAASVAEVAALMQRKQVRLVPIIDTTEKLIGVVSLRDLISFRTRLAVDSSPGRQG